MSIFTDAELSAGSAIQKIAWSVEGCECSTKRGPTRCYQHQTASDDADYRARNLLALALLSHRSTDDGLGLADLAAVRSALLGEGGA